MIIIERQGANAEEFFRAARDGDTVVLSDGGEVVGTLTPGPRPYPIATTTPTTVRVPDGGGDGEAYERAIAEGRLVKARGTWNRLPAPIPAADGGYVGAVDWLIAERDRRR